MIQQDPDRRDPEADGEPRLHGRSRLNEDLVPDASPAAVADEPSPFEPLLASVAELRTQVERYFSIRMDRLNLQTRTVAGYAVLGLFAVLAGAALIVTAAVLLLAGVAGGLAVLFGDRLWAGQLATGAGLLILLFSAVYLWMNRSANFAAKDD